MVEALAVQLGVEYANIYLFDFNIESMATYASYSLNAHYQSLDKRFVNQKRTSLGRIRWLIDSHECIVMDYSNPHPSDEIPQQAIELGFKGAVSTPLVANQDVLGIFNICYLNQHEWDKVDLAYLKSIGRLLGITIQRAQMSRKFSEMLILNERKFLSSEIHDNLAQTVSSLKLGIETALMLFEEGEYLELHNNLLRLEVIGRQAVKSLRDEMLTLRTPLSETGGLAPSVCDSLESFNNRWLVETELIIDGDCEPAVTIQTELQMLRILHEALSNVIRHAQAEKVEVHLCQKDRRVEMRINDNGKGFDLSSISSERLGLRIMKERAEQMGGDFKVQSYPGQGTTIKVVMPSII
jgi:two-component system nitrate/nitrite sensor histidine kinase NarX